MKGREYTFRKWHSLMGSSGWCLLTQHLIVNNFATRGAEAFNKVAGFMELLPFRYALEIFIIFYRYCTMLYMAYILHLQLRTMRFYGYFRNWMFVFQRISGIVTPIFISWHVWETRIQAMLGKEVNMI